ncbi:hypothetical protein LTR94_016881 [Friedmanniomyces endolithicus]|nr:hypothetical protein LTR94_016881 [Friedmanniomyces endolithicus]
MNAQPHEIAAIESLLAFWRDAGVDACYGEAPVDHTHLAPPPALKAVQKATASVAAPLVGPGAVDAIAQARRLAAGAATLQDLAAAVAAFEGCPLRAMGATQSVFGRGDPNAPVLIIGEGPGTEEDRMGQPFVGKAGKLLDRMLAAAGLTGKVFITNTVFWRPPGNRTPTPQEQAPRAVLLLGAASAKSVLQTEEGIMKIRGQWREWRLNEGAVSAPVVPTLHPAFLLRQPQAKRLVWGDLLALSARLDGAG